MKRIVTVGRIKHWIFSILLALMCSGCQSATVITSSATGVDLNLVRKYKVAIISNTQTSESIAFSDLLTTELLPLGFRIIERNRIAAILEEQKMSISGVIEKSNYEVLGQIAHLDAVFVFIAKYNGETMDTCVLKLIDLKTGEVLISTSYNQSQARSELDRDMPNVAKKIAVSIANKLKIKE